MEDCFQIKNGKLLYDNKTIGQSAESPGFSKYDFVERIGKGGNAVVYKVKHKTLNIYHAIKIYFPKDDDYLRKAGLESVKNSNLELLGISAVVFDAGEYTYPIKIWYSVMESVPYYITFGEWESLIKHPEKRDKLKKYNEYFDVHNSEFDFNNKFCKSYVKTSLNVAAGFLTKVIAMYEKEVIHGDLNEGNILWMLNSADLSDELRKYFRYQYSTCMGKLEPFNIKLIDIGSSQANDIRKVGELRDSFYLYKRLKFLLRPLFCNKKYSINEWFEFKIKDATQSHKEAGVRKICVITVDGKECFVNPTHLAGDLFRLICVLSLAFGYIETESECLNPNSIKMEKEAINDFFALMCNYITDKQIDPFGFEVMSSLKKLKILGSSGNLINWAKVFKTYPLTAFDSTELLGY